MVLPTKWILGGVGVLVVASGTAAYVATQAGVFGASQSADELGGEEVVSTVAAVMPTENEPPVADPDASAVVETSTVTTPIRTTAKPEASPPTASEESSPTPVDTPTSDDTAPDQPDEHSEESGESSPPPASIPEQPQEQTAPPGNSTPSCQSNASPNFTHHVTDLTKVSQVIPPPTMASGNQLKTHGYLDSQLASVPVYAPIAATLDSGAYYQEGNPGGEYLLIFRVSCEVTFRFDHLTSPIQSIKDAFPTIQSDTRTTAPANSLSFSAGDQIGTTTGTIYGIWDFGVYSSTVSNRYASDPTWNGSDTYTTAVCPWGYYSSTLYAQYKALFGSLGGNPAHGESFCS